MKFFRLISLAIVVALAGSSVAMASLSSSKGLSVTMKALNGSGENGTATIVTLGTGVRVTVALVGAPNDAQPTHIHVGTCGNINKSPEFALVATVDGKGTTDVPGVTIAELLKGHFAINVHKSATDLATYVSCGNITK